MHILFTRPFDDCYELILRFKSLGHKVSHLPVIIVDAIKYNEPNYNEFKGIIFTSANAVKFLDLNKLENCSIETKKDAEALEIKNFKVVSLYFIFGMMPSGGPASL